MRNQWIELSLLLTLFVASCGLPGSDKLPILGERDVVDGDTIYHTIPDFEFVNQDSQRVTNTTFENKVYIADFFFPDRH